MTNEQKKAFIELLGSLYDPSIIEEKEATSFRSDRLGSKEIHARWTAKEYRILLQIDDFSTVAKKLGRTEMSIIMRVGNIVPQLLMWCEEKGININSITEKQIDAFLKEKEDLKIERRNKKKLRREIIRKIEKMLDDREYPCGVGDSSHYGGECQEGFHDGCRTCPSSKGFIKTKDDIKMFNKIYAEEFE